MQNNEAKFIKWFHSGKIAKQRGHSKVCPFYENLTAEYFFNCGYDGQDFEKAKSFLKEKLKDLLQQNPVIVKSINELANRNNQRLDNSDIAMRIGNWQSGKILN